jgi:hypothetical protein
MLIDTLKPKEGIEALQGLPQEYLEELRLKIPESMGKLITDVITVLLSRLGVSREGIGTVTDMIEKKEDRTMFDAFVESVLEDKRLAVQQEREKVIKQERERWEKAVKQEREKVVRQEREKAQQEREKAQQEKLEGARKLKRMGVSPDVIAAGFGLSLEEIEGL